MHHGGFRRWLLLPGALAAAALLGTGCERDKPMPKPGGAYEGIVNEQQPTESFTGGQPQPHEKGGWADPGSHPPPATGGSGIGTEQQGANPTPDEFRRPQQVPVQGTQEDRTGAKGEPGIGAPGYSSPQEQVTDQGGTRRYEEQSGHGNSTRAEPGAEQGPRSPPKVDTQEQAPKP